VRARLRGHRRVRSQGGAARRGSRHARRRDGGRDHRRIDDALDGRYRAEPARRRPHAYRRNCRAPVDRWVDIGSAGLSLAERQRRKRCRWTRDLDDAPRALRHRSRARLLLLGRQPPARLPLHGRAVHPDGQGNSLVRRRRRPARRRPAPARRTVRDRRRGLVLVGHGRRRRPEIRRLLARRRRAAAQRAGLARPLRRGTLAIQNDRGHRWPHGRAAGPTPEWGSGGRGFKSRRPDSRPTGLSA
jgi:hypothetical protein